MTSFRAKISAEELRAQIESRLDRAARVAGRAASDNVAKEVKRRIPDSGGWYTIYRNAIDYKEDPTSPRWSVGGLSEIKYSAIPVDESLVEFEGKDAFGSILAAYNPWPLDIIPPIKEGYSDNIVTRMAGEGGVESERDRLLPLLPLIKEALEEAGATLGDDSTFLVISGRIYADIAFLARRLELGYSGFPHIPHWSIAIAKLRSDMGKWLSQDGVAEQINEIIGGG
jgi:hypothetical protein